MSGKKQIHFYHLNKDEDYEDDNSDTTKASLIEYQNRPNSPQMWRRRSNDFDNSTWIRWGIVVTIQLIILLGIALLWSDPSASRILKGDGRLRGKTVETGDDINGLYRTSK